MWEAAKVRAYWNHSCDLCPSCLGQGPVGSPWVYSGWALGSGCSGRWLDVGVMFLSLVPSGLRFGASVTGWPDGHSILSLLVWQAKFFSLIKVIWSDQSRWWSRRTWNSLPPTNTSKIHLHVKHSHWKLTANWQKVSCTTEAMRKIPEDWVRREKTRSGKDLCLWEGS